MPRLKFLAAKKNLSPQLLKNFKEELYLKCHRSESFGFLSPTAEPEEIIRIWTELRASMVRDFALARFPPKRGFAQPRFRPSEVFHKRGFAQARFAQGKFAQKQLFTWQKIANFVG